MSDRRVGFGLKSAFVASALLSAACSGHIAVAPTVNVVNASYSTRCAEEDNVYVKLYGEGFTGLRIEARQPSYIARIAVDDSKADFSDCDFDGSHPTDPPYRFEPKRVILWENEQYQLVGNTYATFWRPDQVDVVVSGQVTQQIHLLQLFLKDKTEPTQGQHEFLVFYPPDGYWRAKPIPALPTQYSVYGTSFLIGPVKDAKRPVVELARVEFVPSRMTFLLDYEDGSKGTLHVAEVNRDKVALDYTHDRALPGDQPLAAIRSMFVTAQKADVAEVSWRVAPNDALLTRPLLTFAHEPASEIRFGRSVISRHNASAPDMWFGKFARTSPPPSAAH